MYAVWEKHQGEGRVAQGVGRSNEAELSGVPFQLRELKKMKT